MSVLIETRTARDDFADSGWVLDELGFFPLIAICPGL